MLNYFDRKIVIDYQTQKVFMADFNTINNYLMSSFSSFVESWIPGGAQRGHEYVVKNPTRVDHEAKSFSINTSNGIWKDFAGSNLDKGSNPISLYAYINKLDYKVAAEELAERYNIGKETPGMWQPEQKTPASKETWTTILPVPDNAPEPPKEFFRKENGKWVSYSIVKSWQYVNSVGKLLGYDIKILLADGSKEILPLTYCKSSSGESKWKFIHFKGKRPLYNLHLVAKLPDAKIIVVEGCKCAEALQDLLDSVDNKEYVATTWPGGCNSVKNANWTNLKKRHVIIWPDSDRKVYSENTEKAGQEKPKKEQPGWLAAECISELIANYAASVSIVDVPGAAKPDTWDVADAIYNDKWTIDQVLKHIQDNLINLASRPDMEKTSPPVEVPFRCLGSNNECRYYYIKKDQRVKAIGENSHTALSMLNLADVDYWRDLFPGKHGPDWTSAASYLLNHKDANKVFDNTKMRGRGAWIDNNRIVYNLGNRLFVDNIIIDNFELIDSEYIYERGVAISDKLDIIASDENAKKLLDLIECLYFSNSAHSALLAGFIALAPICGALEWRPHLWLTGGPGTGKSTVFEKIVFPVIGQFGLYVSLDTTAAGLREKIRSDGIPVIHDEAEAQDQDSKLKLQKKIELARQASSSNRTKVIKGSASHNPREFEPHSMFLFGSTCVNLSEGADESRISIIELIIPKHLSQAIRDAHWAALEKSIKELLTPDYCMSIRARSIHSINMIRENAKTFSSVISEKLSEKRAGDQYGTLFAGAYSLVKQGIVSVDDARAFVNGLDFGAFFERSREDHYKLIDHILQHPIKVDSQNEYSIEEIIYKIIESKNKFTVGMDDDQIKLYELLKRNGIRIDNAEADKTKWIMWISNSHGGIARILENTTWPKKWGLIIKRIPGAMIKPLMRFIGSPAQATGIPLENILELPKQ